MTEMVQLPRIPVPDLGTTLRRYLRGLETVIKNPAQMERTRRIVEEFGREDSDPPNRALGQKLQRKLIEFAETQDNWVTPLWLDDMYLRIPLPLPVNSNPFFLLPRQYFRNYTDQLRFASRMVAFALRYKKKIESGQIEPDTARGGKPLCMSSYSCFFNTYRKPGHVVDEQLKATKGTEHEFIIVACKNQFFVATIEDNLNISCIAETEDYFYRQLLNIYQSVGNLDTGQTDENKINVPNERYPPIGLFTTEDRRIWAKIYDHLKSDSTNSNSLELLQKCLFVLCLDEPMSPLPTYATYRRESITLNIAAMAGNLLHGGGCHQNSANRWYDKFLQLIVSRDGVCGVLVEHSVSEGVTVLNFTQEFVEFVEGVDEKADGTVYNDGVNINTHSSRPQVQPLSWKLDSDLVKALDKAAVKMNKLCDNTDLYVLRFMEFGKNFVKSINFSPDCFIQLALQLTYYKVHRELVSTYESASLRYFYLGRVDNIRANTSEALQWVKTMCGEVSATNEEKLAYFKLAMKRQGEIMKYTLSGEGPDNHLMALREMARREREEKKASIDLSSLRESERRKLDEEPEIFRDKSYQQYLNFKLSTSQLQNEHGILVGYGAVVPDGYGCCYVPAEGDIMFCVSSFFSSDATSSDFFAFSLEGSLLQMRELCLQSDEPTTPTSAKIRGKR